MENIAEIIVYSLGIAAWFYIQFDVGENVSFKRKIIRLFASAFAGASLIVALVNTIGWF